MEDVKIEIFKRFILTRLFLNQITAQTLLLTEYFGTAKDQTFCFTIAEPFYMEVTPNTDNLVSIITSTFNNQETIEESWASVEGQTYENWEWIVVNDGSTDGTHEILSKARDARIKVLHLKENMGVSNGRNHALKMAKGDFICFLDGDDILSKCSLSSRVEKFATNENIEFVDGQVLSFREHVSNVIHRYQPDFTGDPLVELLSLSGSVFRGNTWMIKVKRDKEYRFQSDLKHGEDLLFQVCLADGGCYSFTEKPVLYYRQHQKSAMNNLAGLENGYLRIYDELKMIPHVSTLLIERYRIRAQSIMVRSFLKTGKVIKALKSWIKFNNL